MNIKTTFLWLMVFTVGFGVYKNPCPEECKYGCWTNLSSCVTTLIYCPSWVDERGNFKGGGCNQTSCETKCKPSPVLNQIRDMH